MRVKAPPRDRAHMPAHSFEADEAPSEGIKIKWLATIEEIVGPEPSVELMELDARGHPQPTGRLTRNNYGNQ